MMQRPPPTLDLLPDGRVRPTGPSVSVRVLVGAAVLAAVAGGLSIAAVAISIAATLLPIALLAGAVAWATLRWRRWRAGVRPPNVPPTFR